MNVLGFPKTNIIIKHDENKIVMNIEMNNDSALRAMKERLGGKTGLYKFLAVGGK